MITLLLALLTSPLAHAAPLSLLCAADSPGTVFTVESEGKEIIVRVKHELGLDFIPVHEGIATTHDIPLFQKRGKVLALMGNEVEFRFPRERCRIDGPGLLSCAGGEKKKFGQSTEIEAMNFYTGKLNEKTLGLDLDQWKVTLTLWSEALPSVTDMTMKYGPENCRFSGF